MRKSSPFLSPPSQDCCLHRKFIRTFLMSLSVLKCPESSLNISPFFPLPLPICHHSPQCQNCMLPSNLTLRESHLFLQFPPLSSILGALAFLSALPKIMLLWYLMLTKLFYLPPQSQVTFFLLPFLLFISQTPLLPWLLLHLSSQVFIVCLLPFPYLRSSKKQGS